MLSPTDCVKDRLSAFFYWDDRQALKQALLVARAQRVNRSEIRRWARAEKMTARLREFEAEMAPARKLLDLRGKVTIEDVSAEMERAELDARRRRKRR